MSRRIIVLVVIVSALVGLVAGIFLGVTSGDDSNSDSANNSPDTSGLEPGCLMPPGVELPADVDCQRVMELGGEIATVDNAKLFAVNVKCDGTYQIYSTYAIKDPSTIEVTDATGRLIYSHKTSGIQNPFEPTSTVPNQATVPPDPLQFVVSTTFSSDAGDEVFATVGTKQMDAIFVKPVAADKCAADPNYKETPVQTKETAHPVRKEFCQPIQDKLDAAEKSNDKDGIFAYQLVLDTCLAPPIASQATFLEQAAASTPSTAAK